ncbi:hypothetical protein Ahy_B06g080640 isoform D [Arachis hypogaea]|uniref:Uncharacterized protein n=1 Tax=Arachis hypogaea TaxID=3818 RepID=A0A444YIL4_ARAHY|nr:hypothetical protein Ahy_B06g080640 isoform D [Arachis hypogaea]
MKISMLVGEDQHKKSTKQQRGGGAMKKPVSITVILGRVNYLMEISSELVLEIHQVANFGLTKLREVGSFLSLHTRLVGTFGYMPPVGSKCFNQLKVVTGAAPTILLAIKSEENKLQEVMVGLAANVFTFMSSQESSYVFQEAGIIEVELASILVDILKKHKYPATKVLRIGRFAIEFAI